MTSLRRARLTAMVSQAGGRPAAPGGAVSALTAWTVREPVSRRAYTVLRIDAADGVKGYGECAAAGNAEVAETRNILARMPDMPLEPVRASLRAWPNLQAAVNMALLDIVGKSRKAPVYQVLGGPTRHKARALAPLAGDSDAALVGVHETGAGRRATAPSWFRCPPPPARNQGQAWVLADAQAARRSARRRGRAVAISCSMAQAA